MSRGTNIDLGQGFRQTIGDGTSVAAWAGQDLVYAGYNSETKKLSFSTEPPKYIRLLNPWPVSAPGISLNGGAPQGMTIDPNRCGWYYYRVFGETDFEISFSDVNFLFQMLVYINLCTIIYVRYHYTYSTGYDL